MSDAIKQNIGHFPRLQPEKPNIKKESSTLEQLWQPIADFFKPSDEPPAVDVNNAEKMINTINFFQAKTNELQNMLDESKSTGRNINFLG